jgi:membrane associated rhomboid family serine protease
MFSNLPPVTKALLIANGVVFVLQQLLGDATFAPFMLWPLGDGGGDPFSMSQAFLPWQLLTYGFLHGNFAHVAFNMLALAMFGAPLEYTWGERRYAAYYYTCVVGAGLCQLAVASWAASQGGVYPTVGASGGVFGLLLAFGMAYPRRELIIFPIPIPIQAWLAVTLYGALELFLGVTRTASGIAHFAHLGGMATGFVLIQYWRGNLPWKPRRILRR